MYFVYGNVPERIAKDTTGLVRRTRQRKISGVRDYRVRNLKLLKRLKLSRG